MHISWNTFVNLCRDSYSIFIEPEDLSAEVVEVPGDGSRLSLSWELDGQGYRIHFRRPDNERVELRLPHWVRPVADFGSVVELHFARMRDLTFIGRELPADEVTPAGGRTP